ncbi:MAG: helix-turn-helix domain-containing protein [Bacillota bacterium]
MPMVGVKTQTKGIVPCKLARLDKDMTQIEASLELHLGLRTLQRYEQGDPIPRDVSCKMAEVYDAPYLKVNSSSPGAAMNLLTKELDDVLDRCKELRAITCDDEISGEERPRFEQIRPELIELAVAVISLANMV